MAFRIVAPAGGTSTVQIGDDVADAPTGKVESLQLRAAITAGLAAKERKIRETVRLNPLATARSIQRIQGEGRAAVALGRPRRVAPAATLASTPARTLSEHYRRLGCLNTITASR